MGGGMIVLIFFVPVALVLIGMLASGDLRITRRQRREWESRWNGLSDAEIDEIGRKYWR
jgi:hypothetical protein